MGIKVEKTYVKKKKKKSPSNINPQDDNKKEEATEENKETVSTEETTVVMFDVEKINMEASIAPDICVNKESNVEEDLEKQNEINSNAGSSINIFSIEKRTRVSFDDILASINEYNNNKDNAQQSSSSSEDDDSS